jgi:hypothetical protein
MNIAAPPLLGVSILSLAPIVNVYAALIDRGSGLIYDTDQDITWLQDTLSDCGQLTPCEKWGQTTINSPGKQIAQLAPRPDRPLPCRRYAPARQRAAGQA